MTERRLDTSRIHSVDPRGFDQVLKSLDDGATALFALPPGIRTEAEFFAAARSCLPLVPPLRTDYRDRDGRPTESWDAFDDSLFGGLMELPQPRAVVAWRDPWILAEADPDTGRAAIDILLRLPAGGGDPDINGGPTKEILIILGEAG